MSISRGCRLFTSNHVNPVLILRFVSLLFVVSYSLLIEINNHDEPMFSQLACIFGMNDVKVEGANEVVVISDNTQKVSIEVLKVYEAGVDEDEVTSPMVIPCPPVCRKLFDDGADVADRESTTEKGMYFIDIGSDGMLGTRFEKGTALPKPPPIVHPEAGPSGRSPHGSSCASDSPITWWPHNFCRPPFYVI